MKTLAFGPRKLSTLQVVTLGILMAAQLILSRLTIGNQYLRFSFTFLVVALMAEWFGPFWAAIAAGLVDIIGTVMMGGQYFIGFTISAVVAALIYGVAFYGRNHVGWSRIIVAQLVIAVFVNAGLNTLWLYLMYQTPIWAILPTRLLKEILMTPIQIILIYLLLNNQIVQSLKNRL
ncbi:folate family ECF transporter S component [Levilactobacillus bambusae]|uniref:Folate family ECF transporter S component n=1 Tax=Levilactobacillus bambusae TaxID=2024736 RepID=A0A2V1N4I3_9LACO|nr:folate family ECF transporter S component [Levilactobacillus bambusae]PWG00846.1 folate family ECF transporter S component [Levilactobacillus bambusae]